MASNDGFIPYPIGLSANQSVTGIRNGYALPETLKEYSHVLDQLDPPSGDNWLIGIHSGTMNQILNFTEHLKMKVHRLQFG